MNLAVFFSILALFFSIFSMASFSAHSAVYFMILAFLSTGIVYYVLGSTYVAIMLFIVYVGAVAMLFIFCVMLLNLKNQPFTNTKRYYFYIPLTVLVFSFSIYSFLQGYSIFFSDFGSPEWLNFNYGFYSKDHTFLSTFYTLNSFLIMFVGLLLFFVTVVITAILS
jgi:NADH:ubiquinone oxidoreductase subunit 6 (subunit J)